MLFRMSFRDYKCFYNSSQIYCRSKEQRIVRKITSLVVVIRSIKLPVIDKLKREMKDIFVSKKMRFK